MVKKVLDFYRSVVTEEFVKSLLKAKGIGERACIFESAVVVWLMIFQRFNADHTLAAAVNELRFGETGELLKREGDSIRVRSDHISGGTGGYAQARYRVDLRVVEEISDALNGSIVATHQEQRREGLKVYVFDGSTVRVEHTAENLKVYPATKNQHGEAHYPLVRIGVATDVVTGVALRPAYGPYTGPKAVSEHDLAEDLFPQLPAHSVVIGDRYYGCFRFAYQASQRGHDVIVRMKEGNIKRFIGKPSTERGECAVRWSPSSGERKKYETLPADASVQGRMLWYTFKEPGFRRITLFLFTTLTLPLKQIVELYGLRWNVETDIRNIKSTVEMDAIHAKTPAMVAKELILGVNAFNLIRHIMAAVAHAANVEPRILSFSLFLKRIRALGNSSASGHPRDQTLDLALSDISSLTLPKRKNRRPPEPRKIWPTGEKNFMSGSRSQQRALLSAAFSIT